MLPSGGQIQVAVETYSFLSCLFLASRGEFNLNRGGPLSWFGAYLHILRAGAGKVREMISERRIATRMRASSESVLGATVRLVGHHLAQNCGEKRTKSISWDQLGCLS